MKKVIFFLLIFACFTSYSQIYTLKGKVVHSQSGVPIVGVNVYTNNGEGVSTDFDGNFELNLLSGDYTINFSIIGFEVQQKKVSIKSNESQNLIIKLEEKKESLNLVVVSGSRFEKKISDETISVDVINPYLLQNTNSTDLGDVVRRSPGVTISDGQVSIRGGSGFSYGVGSRVMVLVDDLPLLTADLGNVNWRYVPIENVEQIEVVKGPSSVLYGSAALNGIIHVKTGYAYPQPKTTFNIYSGYTDSPKNKYQKWWSDVSSPFQTGFFGNHRQRIGNWDIVVGGNYHSEKSFLERGDQLRTRANFKLLHRPEKFKRISYGLSGNYMYEQSGRFILWVDADTNAFRQFEGSRDRVNFFTLDPHFSYDGKNGAKHNVKGRYYRTYRKGYGDDANAVTNLYTIDYQYFQPLGKFFNVTSGTTGNYGTAVSNLFDGNKSLFYGAIFSQAEFKYERLSAVFGGRIEYNQVALIEDKVRPVFRGGLNYKIKEGTNMRLSIGQGYRVPTIAERFVEASFAGSLNLIPNIDLIPEYSYNFDLGIKQSLRVKSWLGYFDASVFMMDFTNMIEYNLGSFQITKPDGTVTNVLGFKPENVYRARVAGIETSISGMGKVGSVPVRLLVGYTYVYPGDLSGDSSLINIGNYVKNMFTDFTRMKQIGDPSILKYRNRHVFRFDGEFDYKKFSPGFTIMYNSFFENMDAYLAFFDLETYLNKREGRSGDWVFDARMGYNFNDNFRLSALVRNITNLEYADRPGIMSSPRSFMVQFRYTL